MSPQKRGLMLSACRPALNFATGRAPTVRTVRQRCPNRRLRRLLNRIGALGAAAGALGAAGLAQAQVAPQQAGTPVFHNIDANGVDVITGAYNASFGTISVGDPGAGGLSFDILRIGSGTTSRTPSGGSIQPNGSTYAVSIDNSVADFALSGSLGSGTFSNSQGGPETLTYNSGNGNFTYTLGDGTVAVFAQVSSTYWRLISITQPTGESLTYAYRTDGYVNSITSNLGYQAHFSYTANSQNPALDVETQAVLFNMTVDYCDPNASSCSFSASWPTVNYTNNGATATDSLGRQWTTSITNSTSSSYTYNVTTAAGEQITVGYTLFSKDSTWRVTSYSNGAGTWTYSYTLPTYQTDAYQTLVTDPVGHTRKVVSDYPWAPPGADIYPDWNTTYSYDSDNRVTQTTLPGGTQINYTYDNRGNVTQTAQVSSTAGSPANIVTTASYDVTQPNTPCAYPAKCNKPNSTTDALGNETDYTYDGSTGVLLTATLPAPSSGAVRPQVRYSYSWLYPWYKNSSGSVVQGPNAIYELTGTSQCATQASCAGTSDEVKTTIAYGSSGQADNLLPTSVSKGSGDGALTATVSTTYAAAGKTAPATTAHTRRSTTGSTDGHADGSGSSCWRRSPPRAR